MAQHSPPQAKADSTCASASLDSSESLVCCRCPTLRCCLAGKHTHCCNGLQKETNVRNLKSRPAAGVLLRSAVLWLHRRHRAGGVGRAQVLQVRHRARADLVHLRCAFLAGRHAGISMHPALCSRASTCVVLGHPRPQHSLVACWKATEFAPDHSLNLRVPHSENTPPPP